MPSQFFGLNTAYLGLTAANASLNTTSNNIANVETEGYSRQHTIQEAAEALRTFTTYGCAGAGVEVLAIERYRDEFYDVKYWNNQANVGEYAVKEYYMKQIEDYFKDDGIDGALEGFNTIFDEMYRALAEIKKQAGTKETREEFIGKAGNLADYFNTMAGNLQKVQQDVNAEIKVCVDRINAIATEITTLNKQINVIELTGSKANELRDKRALLVDQLSEIVDVKTEEQNVEDKNNPGRYTGATRFIVKIAGGQTLLDDTLSYSLECKAREDYEKVNQNDADGLYDIKWSNGNRFSLQNASMGGRMKALAQMRDGNNGEYFHGTVVDTDQVTIDGAKHNIVTVSVDAEYLKDMNKCTLSDHGGKLMVGSTEVYFDSWSMTYDEVKNSYSYTFVLSDGSRNEVTSTAGMAGKDVSIGGRIEYQGIPYYMEQMNEWVRCYAKAFNDIMAQNGATDNYGNQGQFFFKANKETDTTQWSFLDSYKGIDPNTGRMTINQKDDTYYHLTAFNFAVSDYIQNDPDLIATHTGNGDEESKYDIVEQLVDLKTNKSRMIFRGCSASEFLQCVLSDISLNAQRANTFSENYMNISKSIETQRLSVSGVDNDEEALNLVKYQNAYTLASKMIQTLTEVYDRLISQTGV